MGLSEYSAIAVEDNDNIHVAWREYKVDNYEIFYKKSTDGGSSWSGKQIVSTSGPSERPDIKTDSTNRIYVVWQEYKIDNYEIFCKKSTDGGVTWTLKRLTWMSGDSGFPDMTIGSNNTIHIVWSDNKSGWSEIYYKKGTQ